MNLITINTSVSDSKDVKNLSIFSFLFDSYTNLLIYIVVIYGGFRDQSLKSFQTRDHWVVSLRIGSRSIGCLMHACKSQIRLCYPLGSV